MAYSQQKRNGSPSKGNFQVLLVLVVVVVEVVVVGCQPKISTFDVKSMASDIYTHTEKDGEKWRKSFSLE